MLTVNEYRHTKKLFYKNKLLNKSYEKENYLT